MNTQRIRIKDNAPTAAGYEDYRYSIIDERVGPPFIVWSAPTREHAEDIAAYFASLAPCRSGGHPYPLPPEWRRSDTQ